MGSVLMAVIGSHDEDLGTPREETRLGLDEVAARVAGKSWIARGQDGGAEHDVAHPERGGLAGSCAKNPL
jgi:hypothetical protein